MQYCKSCGRQLKDGMRFCDRCGQSVRKIKESDQAARHREIKELQEERLNRKKRLEEKERKQQRAKEKRRQSRGKFVAIYIIVIILIGLASYIIGSIIFRDDKNRTSGTETPQVSETQSPLVTAAPSTDGEYSEITVGNIRCPYPSVFHSGTPASSDVKMSLQDPIGGAKMIIAQEATVGEPTELIKEYINEIGAEQTDSMTKGDDWYSVTAVSDGTVHHRKCIVRNNLAVYYDFEYSRTSGSASKYDGYISYIDSNFK